MVLPLLSLAKRIIAINSTGPAGTFSLARFVGGTLRRLGFSVSLEKHRIGGVHQANLVARIGPAGEKSLLMNTHLDTVVTDRKRWSKTRGNPFRAVIRGGYLYGLGAADTKTALASQITALKSLDLKRLKRPLYITGTFAEETGMAGVRELIKSRRLRDIRYALNSEPTELQPVIGNHGFRVYRIEVGWKEKKRGGKIHEKTFKGRAAHSAQPWLGRNAIVDCLKWIKRRQDKITIVEMEGGLEANIVAPFCRLKVIPATSKGRERGSSINKALDSRFRGNDILGDILQFLKLSGKRGQTHNIGVIGFKNGRLILKMDHRFPAGQNPDFRLKYLKKVLGRAAQKGRWRWRLEIERNNPAFAQPARSHLVSVVKQSLRRKGMPLTRPGCTEAGYLAKIADEVVTIGPGAAYGNAHQPNERVEVKQLEEAVMFYRRIIEKLCF